MIKGKTLLIIAITFFTLGLLITIASFAKAENKFIPYVSTLIPVGNYSTSALLDYEDCRMFHTACRLDYRMLFFGQGRYSRIMKEHAKQCIDDYFECKRKARVG